MSSNSRFSSGPINGSKSLGSEEIAGLFDDLALEQHEALDRSKTRLAVKEAIERWGTQSDSDTFQAIVEAGRSLGFRCQIVDCTFAEMKDIAAKGGNLIVPTGPHGQWTLIKGMKKSKFVLVDISEGHEESKASPSVLKSQLRSAATAEVRCCLVSHPHMSNPFADPSRARTPFGRLWAILSPEASDIAIIAVFAAMTGLLALATPLAVETLVSTVAFGRLVQPIVILSLMLFAFLAFSAALRALQTFVVEVIQRRLFARVTADFAFRLPRTDFEENNGAVTKELVNRFFDIVTVQKVAASLLLDGISLVFGALIGMSVLAFYHPWLLGFDVMLLALIAFVIFVLGRGAVQSSIAESKTKYKTAAWLEELAGCGVSFRYAGAADFALDRADQLVNKYLTARKKHFRVLMRQILFALGMQAVASTVLLGLGGWLVMTGQLTLGQLVAAELIVTVIVGAFAKLGKHMESYYDLLASVDKLGVLFDLPMERLDGAQSMPSELAAEIEFHGVTCTDSHTKTGLTSFSQAIEAGERLMIEGADAHGHSILLDLIYGMRTPSKGHVSIDGMDPRDIRPDVLRRSVALVRKPEIFHGSIEENVRIGRPDVSVGDVKAALHAVGMLDEVLSLPDGLKTDLHEEGAPLSNRQVTLIALARAIAGHPRLLLIDRTLDALSDAGIESAIGAILDSDHPWTAIVVTGREQIAAQGTRRLTIGEAESRFQLEQHDGHDHNSFDRN
ncbi:peptidase domain-containing ABC transporter [Stratiformator vulcanicus]|uniref:Alpha-hemolysin translocation ATP-binding protein HlyB n=1 Tax=Stratiformator vulcanicus TaxID=2527980 RepID=A0A517QWI5_9PLAN|nr:ABC transporter ATP-binding protein [Stratiformator vulcanicus]QDT35928.1 Alpha-hemolysin translocation ATP-binding protein HlyB [Stratiformator vulcanicus]